MLVQEGYRMLVQEECCMLELVARFRNHLVVVAHSPELEEEALKMGLVEEESTQPLEQVE